MSDGTTDTTAMRFQTKEIRDGERLDLSEFADLDHAIDAARASLKLFGADLGRVVVIDTRLAGSDPDGDVVWDSESSKDA